jgi:hypothetical protein
MKKVAVKNIEMVNLISSVIYVHSLGYEHTTHLLLYTDR